MIYLVFTFIIDFIVSYLFPTCFVSFVIATLNIIYLLLRNDRLFIIISLILGILYDLLYTNYYLINFIFFFISSLLIIKYYKKRKVNVLDIVLFSVLLIAFYDIYLFVILSFFEYSYTFYNLFYKISHSLLFSLIYVIGVMILLKCRIFTTQKKFN